MLWWQVWDAGRRAPVPCRRSARGSRAPSRRGSKQTCQSGAHGVPGAVAARRGSQAWQRARRSQAWQRARRGSKQTCQSGARGARSYVSITLTVSQVGWVTITLALAFLQVDWDYHMPLTQAGTPGMDPASGSIIHFHHFRCVCAQHHPLCVHGIIYFQHFRCARAQAARAPSCCSTRCMHLVS